MIWAFLLALGWLAQSILSTVVGKFADHAVGQFLEQLGIGGDLKKLQNSLTDATLTINTVVSLQIQDEDKQQRLQDLLIRLKDTAYDAEDLFNEFKNRSQKQQTEQQGDGAGNRASSSSYSAPPPSKKRKVNNGFLGKGDDVDDDVQKMKKIKEKIDDTLVELAKICSPLDAKLSSASWRTSSFSTEPRVLVVETRGCI